MKINLDTTDKPERKKRAPKTAFKPGNPYAFKPGESGRSRAKKPTAPDDVRLVSKALRAYLPYRAPDKITTRLGLPAGASWAQVCAMTLLYRGASGDVTALRAVHDLSEGLRQRIGLGFDFGDEGDGETTGGPRLQIAFVSARFQQSEHSGDYKLTETDADGTARTYLGDRLVETRAPRRLSEEVISAAAPEPQQEPPTPTPKAKPWPALAAPRPTAKPQSAQAIRAAAFKKLGYPS